MAERPSLVFAHYFGGSARSWDQLLAAFNGKFDCLVPDLPGFGGNHVPCCDLSLHGYGEYFRGLRPNGPWIAVGHSMGGKIALAAALHRSPELVGLILIASSPPTPEPIKEPDRAEMIAAFGSRPSAEAHFDTIANDLPPKIRAACIDDQLRVDRLAWNWWLERGSRDDISGDVAALSLPVLVIAGDDDKVLGSGTAPAVARVLQYARLEIIAGGGHLVPLEKPAAVASSIASFVVDLPVGATA